MNPYAKISINGLWRQNTSVVQLLGLCPLVAVSTSFVSAFSLGLATVFVMTMANLVVSCLRNYIPGNIRIPVFITIISALVTIVEMWLSVLSYPLYLALGIYLPLIVTNCIVLARVEAFASKNNPFMSIFDGLMMGMGALGALCLLGIVREILATGMLFGGIDQLLGENFTAVQILPDFIGRFTVATLPFAGFFLLGFMVAAKRAIDLKIAKNKR